MIKKKFGFALHFLAVILALIGIISFCKEIRPIKSMAEESSYEEELKYPITETDVHNDMNVSNYSMEYGKTVDINDDQANDISYTVHGDDAITNFIPRDLFKTVGQTFYVGKEYGFLVDTIDLKDGNGVSPRFGVKHSVVMLFNITNHDELIDTFTHFQSTIEVVFEGQFCYLPWGKETTWIDTVTHYSNYDDSAKYQDVQLISTNDYDENLRFAEDCPGQSDYVIAVPTIVRDLSFPTVAGDVCFRQCNKYYLQAPICNVNLYNEYHKNPGDSNYSAIDDEGMYFTQMDISYKGQYVEEKNWDLKALGKLGGECLLALGQKAVEKVLDESNLGTLFNASTAVLDKSKAFYELTDKLQSAAGYEKIQGDENALTYHPFYDSKALQLEYYGALQKEALFIASEYTDGKKMLLGAGNFMMADFSIHIPDEFWETRYRLTWGLQAIHFTRDPYEKDEVITAENPGHSATMKVDEHKETVDALSEGKNSGYLLCEETRQPFTFMPARNGNYVIKTSCNAKNGNKIANDKKIIVKDEEETIIGSNEKSQELHLDGLDVNKRYIFEVQCFDESETVGEYEISIEFSPEKAVMGVNTRNVRAFENEYFSFTPNESGIYSLKLNAPNQNIILRVDNVEEGTTEKTENGNKTLFLHLSKGKEYYIILTNNTNRDESIDLVLNKGESISEGTTIPTATIGSSAIYTFLPTHNGDYKFSYTSTNIVDFSIRNSNFVKLYSSNIGKKGEYTKYYEDGKAYYIEVNGYVDNTQISLSMDFSPLLTEGRSIEVGNISDYNIVKFTPHVSGTYNPTIANDNALVKIYNAGGTDVTNQKLTKGSVYYIVISNATHNTGRLEITLSCDRLYNNVQYTVKSGSNSVAFIAPITGTYSFSGLNAYMVFGSDYGQLYNQDSDKINLEENETYYVEFSNSDAENYVMIKFDPVDLPESGNIILNSTSYFEINVPTATQYSFSARSFTEKNILLQLYNADLAEIDSADNSIILDLSVGKYYLKVNVENIDTMLTVLNENQLNSTGVITYTEGTKVNRNIAENGCLIFKYDYTKKENRVTYYLKLNQTLGENISVKAYYYDKSGNIVSVDMIKTGRTGVYFCDFYKEIKTYYIEVQSEKYKNLEFDLYVPANIASVSINNYKISDYINNLRLGIGEGYSFNVICNDTATYGTKMNLKLYSDYTINVTYSSTGKTLTVPNDKRLFGAILELSFETLDGNDYRMYQFQIVSPYTVETKIANDQVEVTFKDVFGKDVSNNGIYSDINYYYYLNGTRYSIEGSGIQCDLVSIPHFQQAMTIDIVVDYQNSQLDNYTTNLSYSVNNVYGLSQNPSSSGVNKWVINAQNDKTSINSTLAIPSNIKTVNILGKAGTTYLGFNILINSRKLPLTVNLNNFNFSTSNSCAIYASSTSEIILNIYGSCAIATTAEDKDCINVYNLTISGGTLRVTGSNCKTTTTTVTAGKGIYVTNKLTINNCNLTVNGGNGVVSSNISNGYAGANGGVAVYVSSLVVRSSTLTFTGGNGCNGHNGSIGLSGSVGTSSSTSGKAGSNGGAGGNGGNGGRALYVSTIQTWSNNRATLTGGNGGNGGSGGNGGNGGNGINSGNGGNGGNGGTSGDAGSAGSACNLSISYSNVTLKNGTAGQGGNGGNGGNGGAGGTSAEAWKSGVGGRGGNGGYGYNKGGVGGRGGDGGRGAAGGNGGNGGNGYTGGIGGNGGNGGNGHDDTSVSGGCDHGGNGGNGGRGGKSSSTGKYERPGNGGNGGKGGDPGSNGKGFNGGTGGKGYIGGNGGDGSQGAPLNDGGDGGNGGDGYGGSAGVGGTRGERGSWPARAGDDGKPGNEYSDYQDYTPN